MTTFLIIEDNDDNSELLTQLIVNAGFDFILAATGEAGVNLAITEKPDIILLDIQLPDIDGRQVLKRIRASAEGRNIPVITVTSYAMSGDREKLLADGCDGYIEKPIDPMSFMAQIKKILKEHL